MHTADVVRRRFEVLVAPLGITAQQYNVLRILRGAGKAGLPTLDIVDRMVEQAPGITRLIDRREKNGWVRRERSADDRRVVRCHILPAGLKMLEKLDPIVLDFDEKMLGPLSRAEQAKLTELLDRLRSSP
jgi:DNA-binding MarR family transcriptional regulator